MISIIIVFPKANESNSIRSILVHSGFEVLATCSTASQVIGLTDNLDYGIVISGYKLSDMMYSELYEYLPDSFEMLLITSKVNSCDVDESTLTCLTMPMKAIELVGKVNEIYDRLYMRRKREKSKPAVRSAEDKKTIEKAKALLMEQKKMSENEAHRYIQKLSMDAGNGMVETAKMILMCDG